MRTPALLTALLTLAIPLAASAKNHAQEQTPGAPAIGEPWRMRVFVPGAGYVAPANPFGLAIVLADSRGANAGDAGYITPGFTIQAAYANTWAADVSAAAGGALQYSFHYNYGVGAQSSAGIFSRINLTSNYCNSGNLATGNCFTGFHTTSSGSATGTSLALASTSGLAPNTTYYVFPAATGYMGAETTFTTGATVSSPVTLSATMLSTMPSGTGLAIDTAAQTNPFWNGLDGTLTGFTLTDPQTNAINVGLYSACNDPAPMVLYLTGTNDGNLPTLQALKNQAAILDAFGPSGCNKVVISGNEIPRGLATSLDEEHAVPSSSPYTITTNDVGSGSAYSTALFYDDQGVAYAPANSANTLGANDGVALTKVAYPCTPSAGQYCVNAGIYYFSASDAGAAVILQYRWQNNGAAANHRTIHNWLSDGSQCSGSFTDPNGGGTFAISGARCNRPWVTFVDTYSPCLDSSTGTNYFPIPFASIDGLHPIPACGSKVAAAMAAGAATYLGTTPQLALPTLNNPIFAASAFASGTAPTNLCDGAHGFGSTTQTKNFFLTSITPAPSTGIYAIGMKVYASADVPAGDVINCVDTTNNVIGLATSATATGALSGIFGQQDATSVFGDGLLSHLDIPATPPTIASCNSHCFTPSTGHTVTQTIPTGWVFGLTASNTTDLNSGILGVGYGVETNPLGDGYDAFIVQVQGQVHTGALGISLTAAAVTSAVAAQGITTVGDQHRLSCKVQISAGPNGHLWGVYWPQITVTDQTSTGTFTPPGAVAGTYTSWSSSTGGGGTGIEMTDADLANGVSGVITRQLTTPNTQTALMTAPTSAPKLSVTSDAPTIVASDNLPVSATIRFSRCTDAKVPQ